MAFFQEASVFFIKLWRRFQIVSLVERFDFSKISQ